MEPQVASPVHLGVFREVVLLREREETPSQGAKNGACLNSRPAPNVQFPAEYIPPSRLSTTEGTKWRNGNHFLFI